MRTWNYKSNIVTTWIVRIVNQYLFDHLQQAQKHFR